MPGRPHLRVVALLLGTLVVTGSLAGCGSGTVEVDRFPVTSVGAHRCPGLLAALPATVAGESPRPVSGSTYAAAWGDPAIVLRCGVPRPKAFVAGASCLTTNGIDWFVPDDQVDDPGSDVVLTLVNRRPHVEVRLPREYRPNGPSEVMVDVGRAVRRTTETTGHCD